MKRIWTWLLLIALLAWPAVALADGGPLLVPDGQTTEVVVAWGRPVEVAGVVTDQVIVIQGDVLLRSTARVHDRVIAIGGKVTMEPGAQVRKGVFALDLSSPTLNGLLLGLVGFGAIETLRLLGAAALLVVAVLVNLAFRRRLQPWLNEHPGALWRGFLAGAIAALGMGGAALLAGVTVWGWPIAAILGLVGFLGTCFGLGLISLRLGTYLGTLWGRGEGLTDWLRAAVGAVALAVLTWVPLLGWLAAAMVIITALGAAVLYGMAPRKG